MTAAEVARDVAPVFVLLAGALGWVRCWQAFTDLVKW